MTHQANLYLHAFALWTLLMSENLLSLAPPSKLIQMPAFSAVPPGLVTTSTMLGWHRMTSVLQGTGLLHPQQERQYAEGKGQILAGLMSRDD